ncbi:Peptidoglycan/LPS O-acetylase OafA/YrhL, contains acyltransferase and SGNH-hydrolase domains [Rhodococcus triatomae]|uniref:Peptidoglycan/LPS O-acetylase OafA/YrhL, contains acyltransferase and SGNH-hydrolase domains n=1 Tax=Rhodococcus triatomae TaxID=300028 RepID=A0A1G8GU64_9NOCA|nr:Peptidoglycan/LPS O-acetylase OafA/YrhL, contains acyltransferase and SGNH-hydrolase domains [Rhodococcus triatomae]
MTSTPSRVRATPPAADTARRFIPALEGMRGLAALGVLVTHVAFQTATTGPDVLGRVLGRLDLAVALFFALSGFLLWRPHAAAARGIGMPHTMLRYWLSRATRILPAYWVAVVVVLAFLPAADGAGVRTWVSNLALVQVFVPLTLTDGLTQMWSLSVEVAFYLLLPLIALSMVRLRGVSARLRIPVLLTASAVSLVWAFLPVPTPEHVNHDNWLPGFVPWFAAGMLIAELAVVPRTWIHRLADRRGLMTVIAAVAFGLATTDLAGPPGLVQPAPWQYAVKIVLGAVMSFALVAPLVLGRERRYRYLVSPVGLAFGRWSYGIFIWHLAVLSIVFPTFGIPPFSGRFVFVLVTTTVLSIAVASISYALIEEPSRREVQRRQARRADRPRGTTASPAATSPVSTAN